MKQGSVKVWLGFGLLCLLGGSRWLVDAAVPTLLPAGPRGTIHAALIALVLGLASILRARPALQEGSKARAGMWLQVAGFGVLVFGLPGVVAAGASGKVAGLTEELVFLLLPVAVVFLVAQKEGFGGGEDTRGLLGPALAGLAGAALLVPFSLPTSFAGGVWMTCLVGSVLLAGWATVRLHAVLLGRTLEDGTVENRPLAPAAAVIAAGWAVLSAVAPGWIWVGGLTAAEWILEVGQALLLDLPMLLLGVWCLRELAPIRFSARVLIVLLLAIVESFVAARPALTWTMAAGALLLVGGAGWLLREGNAE